MRNMQVFVSVQVTGLFLYVVQESVYSLYTCGCACVLVWSWRLGASKNCVVFCAGIKTQACVGVRCTDSWKTAVFPVVLCSPPRLWPVMWLLRKILLLLGACLNMSCWSQTNALDIPLDGKLNKWLFLVIFLIPVYIFDHIFGAFFSLVVCHVHNLASFSCSLEEQSVMEECFQRRLKKKWKRKLPLNFFISTFS